LIGQIDFSREGRNAGGPVDGHTLNVPTGTAYDGGLLAVADAWNHRVLLWHGFPTRSNRAADIVVGQVDLRSGQANRGSAEPGSDTLNWCYGVFIHKGRLIVADTGNRRVLMWDRIPDRHGQPADLVLGQPDFATRDDNSDLADGRVGMRWPHGISVIDDRLLIADAGLNRIMVWDRFPQRNSAPCDAVLGQDRFSGHDHNRGDYYPSAATLSMPYGVAAQDRVVVIADTANSRLLGFEATGAGSGRAAIRLSGQTSFGDKGDNRWKAVSRNSLCWPYAVAACDSTCVIADSGNNRVLLWDVAKP
jgi:hypothetical protein